MKRAMKSLGLVTGLLFCLGAQAVEYKFEGPWRTINRKLDGIMTAVVTPLGKEKWQGRFYGIWQGVPFDYTETFQGPPNKLSGTAVIDFANYSWTGSIDTDKFVATFGGDRYNGGFELTRKLDPKAKQATAVEKKAAPKYIWHQEHWWYLMPGNRWFYWNDSEWVEFKVRRTPVER